MIPLNRALFHARITQSCVYVTRQNFPLQFHCICTILKLQDGEFGDIGDERLNQGHKIWSSLRLISRSGGQKTGGRLSM